MRLGDTVIDRAGLRGRIVANIGRDQFSAQCPKNEWAYLTRGVLVDTEEAGLVHYENADALRLASNS